MSVCTFIASDFPLKEFAPEKEYAISIDIDRGIIDDGGADENYFLKKFCDTTDYTDKKYGVSLEWNFTEGRAKRIIDYIKNALTDAREIEIWHAWMPYDYEFDDRPFIHKKRIKIDDLTSSDIKKINEAEIWNRPDKNYPERPSFYCFTISAN